ncbi:MAG TPA: DUF4105 domain-containing protein [Gammaproteobacteria bacterium]
MHSRLHSYLFSFVLISISLLSNTYANSSADINELIAISDEKELWLNQEWLNLLHYNIDSSSPSRYTSQVDDSKFFNAPNGKSDPRAELHATIESFYKNDISDDNDHTQCRFIARLEWLQIMLEGKLVNLPKTRCTKYQEWRSRIPDQQLTMIFPAYHLNSPSSMFGHTLLRLDPSDVESGSDWLSIAVNFGANVQQSDNSIFFAFKGLTGGYPGFFIVTPYFNKIKEYNRDENRDIWEYPLNFTPDEIKKMVAHLWELRDIEFDYYFFDENCSYRLLELLEVARPGIELTDDFTLTAIPVDTVRTIENANLVSTANYRPSQATVLEQLIQQIPQEYHDLIIKLAENTELLTSSDFTSIPAVHQRQIIDAAYKLLRYRQTGSPRDEISARNSYQLLEALNTYPATSSPVFVANGIQPEKGHHSKRASIALGKSDKQYFADLGYRMSFHSLEDNENGFLQGAQINIGNLELRTYENESIQLQRLDLVDIFSLTPRSQFFDPLSWRVYTGFERQLTNGKDELVAHVTGGAGFAYQPLNNNQFYALAMLRLENNSEFDNTIEPALGLMTGLLHHFGTQTAHLQLSGEEFSNDETRYRAIYTHNYVISVNHSLKFIAKKETIENFDYSEVSLVYQYYFR